MYYGQMEEGDVYVNTFDVDQAADKSKTAQSILDSLGRVKGVKAETLVTGQAFMRFDSSQGIYPKHSYMLCGESRGRFIVASFTYEPMDFKDPEMQTRESFQKFIADFADELEGYFRLAHVGYEYC